MKRFLFVIVGVADIALGYYFGKVVIRDFRAKGDEVFLLFLFDYCKGNVGFMRVLRTVLCIGFGVAIVWGIFK